jgi:proteasome activator subunit 4
MDLLILLVDKTKSERGYGATGQLLKKILNTMTGVYPLKSRFVNTDEWEKPGAFSNDLIDQALIF